MLDDDYFGRWNKIIFQSIGANISKEIKTGDNEMPDCKNDRLTILHQHHYLLLVTTHYIRITYALHSNGFLFVCRSWCLSVLL